MSVILPLALLLVLYVLALRRPGRHHDHLPRTIAFLAGWSVLAFSLVSPLHHLGEHLLAAHMLQHILLMNVAAPLLVLGRPAICLRLLPARHRQQVLARLNTGSPARFLHLITGPLVAAAIHSVAIWLWHLPELYQAALLDEFIHAVEHLAFFGTALLFWYAVLDGARRHDTQGIAVLALFLVAMQSGMLGALMTLSQSTWYLIPDSQALAWGWTELEDQQLAGLMMWIPAGVTYLVAALVVAAGWIGRRRFRHEGLEEVATSGRLNPRS